MIATFILSTGRCGTQSLTNLIAQTLGEKSVVIHEPIGPLYKPRLTLAEFQPDHDPALADANAHLRRVVSTVSAGTEYVETGWTAFSWFEQYKKVLGDKWRYIHLVRNPVHVAASLLTHGFYQDSRNDSYSEFAALQPYDIGCAYPSVAEEWGGLSIFDKCLYQWLEINNRVLMLADKNIKPVKTVRFEDIFYKQQSRNELFDILNWPKPIEVIDHVDNFHFVTDLNLKPTSSFIWNKTKELALMFGYEPDILEETIGNLNYSKPRV